MSDHASTPEEVEREIEQTRRRVSRDIDELGERLSPRHVKRRAGQVIAIAALGAAAFWLLRPRTRRRLSGPVRAGVKWLLANPTALGAVPAILSLVVGIFAPGRGEPPRLKPPK
jgi:ferric-dicitrate binding protein FerR (iron transport regulator)